MQDGVGGWTAESLVGLAENRDQLVACNLVQLRVVAFENVETHGLFTKRWIYQQHAVPVRSWDALEQCADKVSLRVDHGDSASRFDVIEREIEEESALTDSGRPQNMDVMPGVGGGNPGRRLSPVLEQPDDGPVATRPPRGRERARPSPKTPMANRRPK